MDSVGATARTPRLRRSMLRAGIPAMTEACTPSARGSRFSGSGHGYGATGSGRLLRPSRLDTLDFMFPVLHVDSVAPTGSKSSDHLHGPHLIKKTPRHSYDFMKKSTLAHDSSVTIATHEKETSTLLPGTEEIDVQDEHSSIVSWKDQIVRTTLYGVMNTVILVPLMISFAQIIFRDSAFRPFMSELIKLVMTSAAIHQFCFTLKSSLSFAVGQVQDAGLIFLSAMATSIVHGLQNSSESGNVDPRKLLATTLITLAASTALLGVALIITGKLKLASFVQYLPMPVVGGYLAFIGFYCLEAGLSMMSGKVINGILDWPRLLDFESLVLIAPGLVSGIAIFLVLSRYEHVMILPISMASILVIFYLSLAFMGTSLEQARLNGWVSPLPATSASIFEIYQMFDYHHLDTSQTLTQVPTWIAMYFVVAFSSSLDVAAIEMALGTPLDYNHELQTVGWSNLISGVAGGFTGSYIFSQTIFTLRANLQSRLVGTLVCGLELILVLCPFSIIAYVPKVFFGALQTLIAADLMVEYMWHARHKMLLQEYTVVWLTFMMTCIYNLEFGIIAGIIVAGFNFIHSYITVSSVRRVMKRSHVERDLRERALLQKSHLAIVTLELDGFLFFGSSVKIMEEVRHHVLVNASEPTFPPAMCSPAFRTNGSFLTTVFQYEPPLPTIMNASTFDITDDLRTLDDHEEYNTCSQPKKYDQLAMRPVRTRFFILDFERVRGVDATAIRSCIKATKQLLAQHGILLLFASLQHEVEQLLRAHDILDDEYEIAMGSTQRVSTLAFDTLDKALEWCEDELLAEQGVLPLSELASIDNDGRCAIQLLDTLLPKVTPKNSVKMEPSKSTSDSSETDEEDEGQVGKDFIQEIDLSAVLTQDIAAYYIESRHQVAGELVYQVGAPVDGIYFIGLGKVDVFLPSKLHESMGPGFRGKRRIQRVCQGGILGVAEMMLHKRYQFTAESKADTLLLFLSKVKFEEMKIRHPTIASRFQQAMMQTLARTVLEANIADN
uniref:Sulfate Permease (SulP) Family putative n=1 Tax=Albugo laibachii Nc14 TaxID=890382 RepID=F0WAX5_9STRA|nr:Sulfate Permease (SulP) Family putative [Albugo laibachii Nc14]CCA18429.1 Sulfate Permease (SulP) Family putative [Albugo laibachii Nc14]|eukprot:CCA18429.1 Sulfate Permease (SulP) Family putative [Albugo laibachii Nc14]